MTKVGRFAAVTSSRCHCCWEPSSDNTHHTQTLTRCICSYNISPNEKHRTPESDQRIRDPSSSEWATSKSAASVQIKQDEQRVIYLSIRSLCSSRNKREQESSLRLHKLDPRVHCHREHTRNWSLHEGIRDKCGEHDVSIPAQDPRNASPYR
jgi:hypothetical protein